MSGVFTWPIGQQWGIFDSHSYWEGFQQCGKSQSL